MRTKSPYFSILTEPTEMSAPRRMKLNSAVRSARAKRSLMISSVCRRPRMIRSWVARLYGRTPPSSIAGALLAAGASDSPDTPFSSSSTSSCERNLS
ncbi:hypothetical protein D3C86_1804430 [compost metagenome]